MNRPDPYQERARALSRWVAIIAHATGKQFPEGEERAGAKKFVLSHRLSIAYAFHRRIVRADVVAAFVIMYNSHLVDCA